MLCAPEPKTSPMILRPRTPVNRCARSTRSRKTRP
ncbi:hypothetical protein BMETH_2892_0 [methanotrophic bacterial endosymbiont of Bathymodiolus sp.]|nr:hypothetical protein BMETH_2892_0 [methanotrophic bacterial endosymbiont of Bathymodiolus sp.]